MITQKLDLTIKCPCGNELPPYSTNRKYYCNDCRYSRQKESQNRKNRKRAGLREYEKLQINLVKNWIYWGVRR